MKTALNSPSDSIYDVYLYRLLLLNFYFSLNQ